MRCGRYSVLTVFPCVLGWAPWYAPCNVTTSTYSAHHLLLCEPLKCFLKFLHISPPCSCLHPSYYLGVWSSDSHFHIHLYKHWCIGVDEKVCACVCECGFFTYPVRATVTNESHMRTIQLSHPSSGPGPVLLGLVKENKMGRLLRHLPFLVFWDLPIGFCWLLPREPFEETPLWHFWTGQCTESQDLNLMWIQSLGNTLRSQLFLTQQICFLGPLVWFLSLEPRDLPTYWNQIFLKIRDMSNFQDFPILKHPWNSPFLSSVQNFQN